MRFTLAFALSFLIGFTFAQSSTVVCSATTSSSIICNTYTSSPAKTPCASTRTVTRRTKRSSTVRTSTAPNPTGTQSCDQAYSDCRTQPNANQAFCASQYAGCLTYNPFGNGTTTGTGDGNVYTTKVVSEFVTYCPSPTIMTIRNMTYTVTAPTTLTISNCPSTITLPKSVVPGATKPATQSNAQSAAVPTSLAAAYTSMPTMPPGSPMPSYTAVVPPTNAGTPPASPTMAVSTSLKPIASYTGAAERLAVGQAVLLGALGMLAL